MAEAQLLPSDILIVEEEGELSTSDVKEAPPAQFPSPEKGTGTTIDRVLVTQETRYRIQKYYEASQAQGKCTLTNCSYESTIPPESHRSTGEAGQKSGR